MQGMMFGMRGLDMSVAAAEPAVEARGVVKQFGAGVVALDGLDLQLGLVRPTAGGIQVPGRSPGDPVMLPQAGAMGEVLDLTGRRTGDADPVRVVRRRRRDQPTGKTAS